MICKCGSNRMVSVVAKASDCFNVTMHNTVRESNGYLPKGLGIGGGDYIDMEYCLECGQIKGQFPIKKHELEDIEPPSEE